LPADLGVTKQAVSQVIDTLVSRGYLRFCPIFPVRDVRRALAHYAALGFEVSPWDDGTDYGFARRDGAELHLAGHHDHGDEHEHEGGRAYLFVRDADALYEEWSGPGIGGQTFPVELKPWKVREGSHIDPDGNVIRFGTLVKEPAT
jgi:hypothetical protein